MTLGYAETPIFVLTKYSNCFNYRKTSKEARGSYSFSKVTNAGLIRNWLFFPIEVKNYCGPY